MGCAHQRSDRRVLIEAVRRCEGEGVDAIEVLVGRGSHLVLERGCRVGVCGLHQERPKRFCICHEMDSQTTPTAGRPAARIGPYIEHWRPGAERWRALK